MRRLGLVAQQVQETTRPAPTAGSYAVTGAGRERQRDWTAQWQQFVGVVGERWPGGPTPLEHDAAWRPSGHHAALRFGDVSSG
jgi:hypothetical protein